MKERGARALAVLACLGVLAPDAATACATCLDTAWGNRGFSWAFVGLMLAPFAVVAGLAAVLAWGHARGAPPPAAHLAPGRGRPGR